MTKETAERSDLKMEEVMMSHERGECEVEFVQKVSQDSMLHKYKAELAQ